MLFIWYFMSGEVGRVAPIGRSRWIAVEGASTGVWHVRGSSSSKECRAPSRQEDEEVGVVR